MKAAGSFVRRFLSISVTRTTGHLRVAPLVLASAVLPGLVALPAFAQAPYLLPYTIQSLAGGGSSPTVGASCTNAATGVTGTAYDAFGDGCPVGSPAVIVGAASDIHDVAVDPQGNVFFIDNGSSNGVIRRIDAHSGIVTVYAGSFTVQTPVCASTQDKYGDGCPANDGKANAGTAGGYTGALGKLRGLGISSNGDLLFANYGNSVVHKIAASTGLMSVVAGSLASTTKLSSNGGVKGFSGDGGVAFNPAATPTPQGAALNSERGVARDLAGNVYIADSTNNVIRKVTYSAAQPLGIISTIAGSDANAPSPAAPAVAGSPNGDGGPAAAALLLTPEDVEVDAFGNLFIADFGTSRVRVVYAGGTLVSNLIGKTNGGATPVVGNIYSIVGNGIPVVATVPPTPTTSNPGPLLATSVPIGSPRKISLDAFGNLFVADNGNDVIWFVDATTGYMRVIAGTLGATASTSTTGAPVAPLCAAKTDSFGDNCPATTAALNPNSAMGASVDAAENLYITDSADARLRKVSTNQAFPATPAGATSSQIIEVHFAAGDGPAAASPYVLTGSQDFTVASASCTSSNADNTKDCLLTVNFTPTVAGSDTSALTVSSLKNGAVSFSLSGIGSAASVAFDPGTTSILPGGFSNPQGIAQDFLGNIYIADTGNHRILRLAPGAAFGTSIAGLGTSGYSGDNGPATAAALNAPRAVAIAPNGLIFIADTGNNVIRRLNPATGVITTVAGGASATCPLALDAFGDGCLGTSSTFKSPSGLAVDADGNLYIADTGNNLIRELTTGGSVVLYGGGASAVCATGDGFGNGCPALSATFLNPTGLQVDSRRNVYVADTGDNLVREIVAGNGTVVSIAGTGQAGGSGNGGTATGAQLSGPTGLAVDAAGDVYIADTGNSVIRLVSSGTINTVAGTLGAPGTGSLPGSAFAVQLTTPAGVVSNGAGALVILDSGNNRAFTDNRASITYNFGRTNLGSSSPTLQIQETSTGSASTTLGSPVFSPAPAPPFALAGTGSSGCSANQVLTAGSSCLLLASFSPSATQAGNFNATFTETTSPVLAPSPFIQLSGTGAVLTSTTSTTVITNPATGSPQYPVPFTVTTTVVPASCNLAAPTCFPTGTVTFYVNGTQVGLAVSVSATGTASQAIPGQNVGSYAVTSVYSGDLYYASGSAPALTVVVTVGATTTVVSANPANGHQFDPLVLTATVTPTSTVKTTSLPTGIVTFFAGTTQLAVSGTCGTSSSSLSSTTGIATLSDIFVASTKLCPEHDPNSFGLPAGTYAITAKYSGDTNYAPSTSVVGSLTIGADAATFTVTLAPSTAGTAQGSTASVLATINANNTYNGTISFSCTNMPANSTCTFGPPTTLTFAAVPGVPVAQQISITLFTDVPAGVTPTSSRLSNPNSFFIKQGGEPALAGLLGWPVLLASVTGMLAFRKRLRHNPRLMNRLTLLALFGLLAGGSTVLAGCSGSNYSLKVTPTGSYTINFVATGTGGVTVSTPITFVVGTGAPGQL